jgi:hypothetical protein
MPSHKSDRQDLWSKRLDEAESSRPSDFPNNGWVVAAYQAAWSAIATDPRRRHAALVAHDRPAPMSWLRSKAVSLFKVAMMATTP